MSRTVFQAVCAGAGWSAMLLGGALSLRAAPPNDAFVNALVLSGATNSVTGSNAGASPEPVEPLHAGVANARSVWWRWTAPGTGTVRASTEGSAFDTALAVYTGDAIHRLRVVAFNDDADDLSTSRVLFRAVAGETFHIAVDGFGGATGFIRLGLGPAGTTCPAWAVTNVAGGLLSNTNFTNLVLVIDFWETSCQACVDEIPELIITQTSLQPRGFSLLGLAKYPTDAAAVRSFGASLRMNYPLALTSPALEQALGGLPAVPTKYVVDREGRLVDRYLGARDGDFLLEALQPLLRGSSQLRLEIERRGDEIKLTWPATEFGRVVEGAEDVFSHNWAPLSAPVQTVDQRNTVLLPRAGAAGFYRLKTP